MNTEPMRQSDAKAAESILHLRDGTINSEGVIGAGVTLYTDDIKALINEHKADFWVLNGQPEISNWPRKIKSEFCRAAKEVAKPISRRSAQVIQGWLDNNGGSISRTGVIKVHNISTRTIKDWLHLGAHVYYCGTDVRISNWVPPSPREFLVKLDGAITPGYLRNWIEHHSAVDKVVCVEEKGEDEDDC